MSPLRKSSRDGAQEPLRSSPRARPTLKPKVTYYEILQEDGEYKLHYEILREDGEYKLHVELTIQLSTHKHASRLGALSSKSNKLQSPA
jgi:dsRNA-specific ribonuclease